MSEIEELVRNHQAESSRDAPPTIGIRWGIRHYFLINSTLGALFITFIRALGPEQVASAPPGSGGLGSDKSLPELLVLGILTGNCVGFACLGIGKWLRARWAHLQPEQRTLLYFMSFGGAGIIGAVIPLTLADVLQERGASILVLVIGVVAAAVSVNIMVIEEMRERLGEYYRDVQHRERVERDLRTARMVQNAMLPSDIPDLPAVQIAARSLPAKEVGGDYFDFIPLPDGRCLFAVADVAGKGLPAALLMSALRAGLRTLADESADLPEMTARLNRLILASSDKFNYITFVLGVLDPETRRFSYVNAGHNPPLHFKSDGNVVEQDPGDLVLGVMPDIEYHAKELLLEPGEVLAIYTDGMIEQHGLGDADFGLDRLIGVIEAHAASGVKVALDRTYKAVSDFTGDGDQYDDQTMVLIVIEPS